VAISIALTPALDASAAPQPGVGSCRMTYRRYHTLPDIRTTSVCVIRRPAPGTAPGLLLIAPRPGKRLPPGEQWSAMILTNAGRLVWYTHRPDRLHDLMTVRYRGQTLLALYQRSGKGYFQLLDRHYREVTRIEMGDGYQTDMHELRVTPRGTAYIDAYQPVHVPGVGRVMDWVMREIDIATHRVLFEWRALDHVPPRASYRPQRASNVTWDFFHGNSIDPPAPGGHTVIVSSRNTSAVYGIDRRTGAVRWVLGGKRDQFGMRRHPDWWFCGQHDARWHRGNELSLFDNGGSGSRDGSGCGMHPARVPILRLDTARRRVHLVRMIPSGPSSPTGRGFFASAVGSARRQPNGDMLISWGTSGYITQVAPDGRVKFAMRLEPWTYRAVRANWRGYPPGRPAVLAQRSPGGAVDVWASWNGATQIHDWRILAGSSAGALRPAGRLRRFEDLETHMRLRTSAAYVAVRAVSARGRVLGTSAPVPVTGGGEWARPSRGWSRQTKGVVMRGPVLGDQPLPRQPAPAVGDDRDRPWPDRARRWVGVPRDVDGPAPRPSRSDPATTVGAVIDGSVRSTASRSAGPRRTAWR
jgi:hypothetical protein